MLVIRIAVYANVTVLTPSGVATPEHTRACAHLKFAGAWVKKVKVKDQLLACAIASFMWR